MTESGHSAEASGRTFTVEGRVRSKSTSGTGGLVVEIVARGVARDITLGRTVTDPDGRYRATITVPFEERPDMQARVWSRDDATATLLGESDVGYDAGPDDVLDIDLRAPVAGLASEFEVLTAALGSRYAGPLAELEESDERQDITYLANKTGWDARAIAMAALADQLGRSDSDDIPAALYYALLRAGLPAAPDALYRTDPAAVDRVWRDAMARQVIPDLELQLPRALAAFEELATDHGLQARHVAGTSSLGELLELTFPGDADRQRAFARLHAGRRDTPGFWDEVETAFDRPTRERLELDGQLAVLTLNNAPLIEAMRAAEDGPDGDGALSSPADLARRGYFRAERWKRVVAGSVPQQIRGASKEEQEANYAELLAARVRASFPTAAIAAQVKSGDLLAPVDAETRDHVHAFLDENLGRFAIGVEPLERFLARNADARHPASTGAVEAITQLQRVYQLTPDDRSMKVLLDNGLDSALSIAERDRDEFAAARAQDIGEADARLIHARAQQIHNAVLNIATSYLTARIAPALGSAADALVVQPVRAAAGGATGVEALPTLEGLFGSLDYCACEQCRSVLSPAAYLVDLLGFIDRANAGVNPLDVFRKRRPDAEHLPLTCENTNTPLPYIDLVNETLEYFVAHHLTLDGYAGHDTADDVAPEELLAEPQYVDDVAYGTLAKEYFPLPLPYNDSLETLRRLFAELGVPLWRAMADLRASDAAWDDILIEQLGLSRAERRVLTDRTVTLQQLFGLPDATAPADVLSKLSGVKFLARRLGVTYEDIVSLLRTRFVNPSSTVLGLLERLKVSFDTIKKLKDGAITKAQFTAMLPPDLDAQDYGGDVAAWVTRDENYGRLMSLIVLAAPPGGDAAAFDELQLQHFAAAAGAGGTALGALDFVRLIRFVRLWRKLGWTIEQTDAAIAALVPPPPAGAAHDDAASLDAGCATLLQRLGIAVATAQRMGFAPGDDLSSLLACWAPIDAHGPTSLYRRLLISGKLALDKGKLGDDGVGDALRAAFGLTAADFTLITGGSVQILSGVLIGGLGFNAQTPLTLENISAIYRRGWLARTLGLTVGELLALTHLADLDPFAVPAPPAAGITRLLDLLDALRAADLAPASALELVFGGDVRGTAGVEDARAPDLARALRAAFTAIESELSPEGGSDRARDALAGAYGADTADFFFGVLNGALSVDVAYDHAPTTLEAAVVEAAGARIAYDPAGLRLSYAGAMTEQRRDALIAVPTATPDLRVAVTALFQASEDRKARDVVFSGSDADIERFFADHPKLRAALAAYAASGDPVEVKRARLVAGLLPEVRDERRRGAALTVADRAAGGHDGLAQALLTDPRVLHAAAAPAQAALEDLLAVGVGGLEAPAPAAGGPFQRNGYLEVPESGSYDIGIDGAGTANVTLTIDGAPRPLVAVGAARRTATPIALAADVLHAVNVSAAGTGVAPTLSWRMGDQAWQEVPAQRLYASLDGLAATLARFLKAAGLSAALHLTGNELAHLPRGSDLEIDGRGWLNALPAAPGASPSGALARALGAVLDLARLKAALSPGDERLLAVLRDPGAGPADGGRPLLTLTRWEQDSLAALLGRFGLHDADLADPRHFARVYDAYGVLSAFGISAAGLIRGATNDPDRAAVNVIERALQARLGRDAWFTVLRSINDPLRRLRRDALVAYVLRELGKDPATEHVDTPDKLFEYFLMDVQMEPCMQTSRIRHVLSSVQLFIERVLMNLERDVPPSKVSRARWESMKRYRVWEANRKVFLWPENWLEPELRNDQSPFFRQTMSQLLQSDITEDSAATALLSYLSSLEEVAKLEPCSIHYVEGEPEQGDEIAHVVARTAGAPRKYYYRRRAYGAWTPWEQISVDIEDNPVTPVVWKGRLLLFWLKILQSNPPFQPGASTDTTPVANVQYAQVRNEGAKNQRLTPQAVLCWSEYYNGRWQAPKTSDINAPSTIGSSFPITGSGAFDRARLVLGETTEPDALRVRFWSQRDSSSFLLYNTHSLPLRQDDEKDPPLIDTDAILIREMDSSKPTFEIKYIQVESEDPVIRQVVTKLDGGLYGTVEPYHIAYHADGIQQSLIRDVWRAPFFYEDNRHAFYVTTDPLGALSHAKAFGVAPPRPEPVAIPQLTIYRGDDPSPEAPTVRLGDGRTPKRAGPSGAPLALDAGNIEVFLDMAANVRFAGSEINPQGRTPSA